MTNASPFGKYQLLERAAVGGMAELYRGKITGDQGFEKLVAIKCILPQFSAQPEVVEAFIDEAKLAAYLQHENIVQIYDFGCMGDRYFMAMEYLFGKDLRFITDRCSRTGVPIGLDYILHIVARVCSGLEYAHNLRGYKGEPLHIVHRDISPQNIFITYSGLVKILDFGVAKAAGRSTCTQSGVIKGKAAYMSPEQATGGPVDRRSDIFALGILLYELVTGRRMFEGEPLEILDQVRNARYVPPESLTSGLPDSLFPIIHRALTKNPEDRYPDCGRMLSDVEACIAELPAPSDTRQLGRFVRGLFKAEMKAEELALRGMMPSQGTPVPGGPPASGATATLVARPSENRRFQLPGRWLIPVSLVLCLLAGMGAWFFRSPWSGAGIEVPGQSAYTVTIEPSPESPGAVRMSDARGAADSQGDDALPEQVAALAETDPSGARELLEEALERKPGDPRVMFHLGLACMRLKDYPRAIEMFTGVLEKDPGLYNAVFNLAYAHAESGDFEKAEQYYVQTVEMAPPYLDEALFNLAIVQDRLGKLQSAIRQLELAVQYNPHNVRAIEYLYRLRGKWQEQK
ncbi:MAG: protein kinase domain-containing protein [Desulfobacterales bacterium]